MKGERLLTEDFTNYSFLSTPQFSPDGSKAAFVRKKANLQNNSYDTELWVVDIASGEKKQIAVLNDGAFFCWEDGTHLLYPNLKDAADILTREQGELLRVFYAMDICSGKEAICFKVKTNANHIEKLDNGTYLLTSWFDAARPDAENAQGEEKARRLAQIADDLRYEIVDEIPFWWDGLEFTNKKRTRVYLYDKAADKLSPVTEPLFDTAHVRKVAGKNQLLLAGQTFSDIKLTESGLYLYDMDTGETHTLLEGGKLRIYWADALGENAVIAATDMKTHGMYENPKFYSIPLSGGPCSLLADYDRSISDMVVTDSKFGEGGTYISRGDKIWFISTERFHTELRNIDTQGRITSVIAGKGAVNMFDICGDKALHVSMRGLKLQELYVYDMASGTEKQLTDWNDIYLADKALADYHHFSFQTRDGFELDGWVLFPVDYQEGETYPAILDIHGGPPAAYGEIFVHEMQLWANAGYFVFFTNPRGGEGRGNAFMDIRGRWGEVDYADFMDFTDEVLKRYPMIDKARVGVTGGSYGGYMTNWIVGHTDRFAAAASQRSVANTISMVGHSGSGFNYNVDQINTDLWEGDGVLEYWKHSPLKYANRVKTPILFIHSDQDRDCFISEGLQMFTAVRLHGCKARMCIFKGEGHGLSRTGRPLQRIRRLKEITGWFDQHLK